MKIIAVIEGWPICLEDDGRVHYIAKAAIDDDGSDNREKDPDWQPNTSLRFQGKSIDAESVPYVVVPPAIIHGVVPVVLGCMAKVTDTRHPLNYTFAVVADIGPHHKLGEISIACARAIDIPSSPTKGGVDDPVILYELWPGTPAVLAGITYELQASKTV